VTFTALKYPVLLVHGAGLRDTTFGINYWGRIPAYLSSRGIKLYYGATEAWGTIENNAALLKSEIITILEKEKTDKVNIIAHSRGGLEARYLISSLRMDYAVASLTTVSTPHRGVKAMNQALKIPKRIYKCIAFLVNIRSRIIGDRNPDFFTCSRQLAEKSCLEFNKKNLDSASVYYQSYTSRLKYFFSDPLFMLPWLILKITDGDNDGLCPVASAGWGERREIIRPEGLFGISHAGILDWYRIRYKGADIRELYGHIVQELSAKGF
jgi:triacylglycerol lipase